MMEDVRYTCPVCGYLNLTEPPWDDGSPSDEICPSCGMQFGYDDAAGADAGKRQAIYLSRREAWRAAGYPWFSRSRQPPAGWDPGKQLEAVEA
jgi:hypothetical protein